MACPGIVCETALDFIGFGFGPVYLVDHSWQGLSPRLLYDQSKGHIENFRDYITDMVKVVDDMIEYLQKMGAGPSPRIFFISSSLGGAISIGYFQMTGQDNPFAAAALLATMIRSNYIGFMDVRRTRLNLDRFAFTLNQISLPLDQHAADFEREYRCHLPH